jgi:hypothetical protein
VRRPDAYEPSCRSTSRIEVNTRANSLIHLAEENSPTACFDDRRAMDLLRREATPDELRELGMTEQLIAHVFAEEHAR